MTRRWWAAPLGVYVATRLLDAVFFVVAGRWAVPLEQFVASGHEHFGTSAGTAPPGYLTTVTRWDGQWYWEIAANGYPRELPVDASGHVVQNPWAFYPLYPATVRLLMVVTRLDFPVAASVVSLVAGAAAVLVLHRLVARRHGPLGGLLAVLAVSTFVCAPVLQMAYAEGLALLLVVLVLTCVTDQRYVAAAVALGLLALTRGVAAAFAPALVLHAVLLWRRGSLDRRRTLRLAALAAWALVAGVAWPVVAGVVTGEPRAYALTQQSWGREVGTPPVLRFVQLNSDVPGGVAVAAVVAAVWTALLIWLLTTRQEEPALRAWSVAYVLYLLALIDWNWSALRYYLLAVPVFWPLVRSDEPRGRAGSRVGVAVVFAVVGLATQWWWVRYCVVLSPQHVQVP